MRKKFYKITFDSDDPVQSKAAKILEEVGSGGRNKYARLISEAIVICATTPMTIPELARKHAAFSEMSIDEALLNISSYTMASIYNKTTAYMTIERPLSEQPAVSVQSETARESYPLQTAPSTGEPNDVGLNDEDLDNLHESLQSFGIDL